jgi:hypothetical protein
MNALWVVLFLIVIIALAVWLSVGVSRREDGRLRLFEAARGQGVALPEPGSNTALHTSALAVRRCVLCSEHSRCDALLEARDWRLLREICPNTDYIDRLQRYGGPANPA